MKISLQNDIEGRKESEAGREIKDSPNNNKTCKQT